MEYQLTFEVSEYGRDPENGERFLTAFMDAHPETGPVVMQNTETGVLTVMFSFDADDFTEVAKRASDIFVAGAESTGLPATKVISAHIDLVPDPEDQVADDREPVLV